MNESLTREVYLQAVSALAQTSGFHFVQFFDDQDITGRELLAGPRRRGSGELATAPARTARKFMLEGYAAPNQHAHLTARSLGVQQGEWLVVCAEQRSRNYWRSDAGWQRIADNTAVYAARTIIKLAMLAPQLAVSVELVSEELIEGEICLRLQTTRPGEAYTVWVSKARQQVVCVDAFGPWGWHSTLFSQIGELVEIVEPR